MFCNLSLISICKKNSSDLNYMVNNGVSFKIHVLGLLFKKKINCKSAVKYIKQSSWRTSLQTIIRGFYSAGIELMFSLCTNWDTQICTSQNSFKLLYKYTIVCCLHPPRVYCIKVTKLLIIMNNLKPLVFWCEIQTKR